MEYICDDCDGKYKWFFDKLEGLYICINPVTNKYAYKIKVDDMPSLDEFIFRKMSRFVRDGIVQYIPQDKLQQMSAPRSQAVMKIMKHKEALNGNNN